MEMADGRPHGFGVVAGDALERDTLRRQRFQYFPGLGAQLVAERDQGQRSQRVAVEAAGERLSAVRFSEHQDAQTLLEEFFPDGFPTAGSRALYLVAQRFTRPQDHDALGGPASDAAAAEAVLTI